MVEPESLNGVCDFINNLSETQIPEGTKGIEYFHNYCTALLKEDKYRNFLETFNTFLPPRLVIAAKKRELVPFFGAGISASAGIPTWIKLLDKLGIPSDFANDPYLDNDALTTAELIAHEIGNDYLQNELRKLMKGIKTPSLSHYLIAHLSQPIYITSNYDSLFKRAYLEIHGEEPLVITNDADLQINNLRAGELASYKGKPIILKIHGCVSREGEQLILTRSQYRHHYRSNNKLFDAVRKILESKQAIFFGFGHKDPEISRLVEDVIHYFENNQMQPGKTPAIYSLQFDMKEKTPEVFAARGIVALNPHISLDTPKELDYRTVGLNKALIDLLGAMDSDVHKKNLNLNILLEESLTTLEIELGGAMKSLSNCADEISKIGIDCKANIEKLLSKLRKQLGDLAGQGVYLLNSRGDIICTNLKPELQFSKRQDEGSLRNRFYVKQAKTFRRQFISDSDRSTFNGQSTIFLCQPIGGNDNYFGLLFSAAQIGAWKTPIELKKKLFEQYPEASFLLIDSNGVALLPPNNDEYNVGDPKEIPEGEDGTDNQGFDYDRLLRLSRRDQLIYRIWKNIVPLSQDDDIQNFSDLKVYSVVSMVKDTNWKLALSLPLPGKKKQQ